MGMRDVVRSNSKDDARLRRQMNRLGSDSQQTVVLQTTSDPGLEAERENGASEIRSSTYDDSATPRISTYRARGSKASPKKLEASDVIGAHQIRGRMDDGTNRLGVELIATANSAWGTTSYVSATLRGDDGSGSTADAYTCDFENDLMTIQMDTRINGDFGLNVAPIAKPEITGSRGANAALASLLTALANYGLITDSTS